MIVYVGNMLSRHGSSINFMELIVPKLRQNYTVAAASSNKNKLLRFLEMLSCILRNRHSCRLVLIDTYSTQAFIYAYFTGRLCQVLGLPYVPVLHGGNLPERYHRSARLMQRFLGSARNIVCPSVYLRDFFSLKGFSVEFVPNFIELDNYRFLSRDTLKPNLLWVRSFQEIYNPVLAIKALKIVLERYPNATLCMVGAAKDYTFNEVKALVAEYGLSGKVTFTGILSKSEWVRLSENYDIFINTTKIDNMPISVIEAMALGLPVVSTNVGGIPYLIEHNFHGLLVPSDDARGMASAIFDLIENPQKRRGLTENARLKVSSFDWKRISVEWRRVIDNYFR